MSVEESKEVNEAKKDILVRLRRIEGQVKGIEKMVDNDSCCKDVLVQIAAIRAAINKVGGLILENYAKDCINCYDDSTKDSESINDLISTLLMFIK
jgi:CsoR family transcriptional regulator, copper-sensing transcriptional repressor